MQKTLEIDGMSYTFVDKRSQITLADSFVDRNNKIGSGNGEAKLYVGNEGKELREFFGKKVFSNKCFLTKDNISKYLYDCKYECYHPSQPYRSQNNLFELWEKRNKEVESLGNIIEFSINEQEQITPPRIYIKSKDNGFELIRELSLPNLTNLSIIKLKDLNGIFIYWYKLEYENLTITVNNNENDGEETEFVPILDVEEEEETFQPYNTEKISIDTKKMSMDACLRRMEQGRIVLNPDFQRNIVWNIEKKSKLIESLMLKIPIPMFYVSSDEKEIYSVVDGLQRLSTIRDFVLGRNYLNAQNGATKGNGFKLEKLEFWGDRFNDLIFNDLPIDIQSRILETEFTFTIINPGTPEEVKRNIFKRINTGGEPLTSQEIRNALYTGQSTILLKKLALKNDFLQATDYSVKTGRMMEQELILRSIAFLVRNYVSYSKNSDMDKFLSDTMRIINIMPDFDSKDASKFFREEKLKKEGVKREDIQINDITNIEDRFKNGMTRAKAVFGKHAFRKSYGKKRRTPINKALFEVWSVLLSTLNDTEYNTLLINKRNFMSEYSYLLDDNNFNYIISRDSLKFNSVQERYKQLTTLLKKYTV